MPFLMLVAEDIPASRYLLSLLQLRHTQAEMRASAGNPTFCLGTFLLQSRLDHRQLCDGGAPDEYNASVLSGNDDGLDAFAAHLGVCPLGRALLIRAGSGRAPRTGAGLIT